MNNNTLERIFDPINCDKRIISRLHLCLSELYKSGNSIINQTMNTRASKVGAYRILNNDKFTHMDLLDCTYKQSSLKQNAKHLLCIQDTTEFNFSGHINKKKLKDPNMGDVFRKPSFGFFCHPTIILDPNEELILGYSNVQIWNRTWGMEDKHSRKYKQLPIEEKESYRWIKSVQETKNILSNTSVITHIGDRENDIYEAFSKLSDEQIHLLIRMSTNRKLTNQEMLFDKLSMQKVAFKYSLNISGNNNRTARKTTMNVKFVEVELKCPKDKLSKGYPKSVKLWAIETKEANPPKGEEPIHWRLLTTHELSNLELVKNCIEWYKKRWYIEELFRVLKSKGFNIEATQLHKGKSIKKLTVLAMISALEVMNLKLTYNRKIDKDASIMFNKEQIMLMKILIKEYEGKTLKQKNNYKIESILWATWLIARMGGWDGYDSSSPPGYITIKNGLDKFHTKFELYKSLIKNVCKD